MLYPIFRLRKLKTDAKDWWRGFIAWGEITCHGDQSLHQPNSSGNFFPMKLTRVREAIEILTLSAEELYIEEKPRTKKSTAAVRAKKAPAKTVRSKKTPAKSTRAKKVVKKTKRIM
jgi:hypothetical protein